MWKSLLSSCSTQESTCSLSRGGKRRPRGCNSFQPSDPASGHSGNTGTLIPACLPARNERPTSVCGEDLQQRVSLLRVQKLLCAADHVAQCLTYLARQLPITCSRVFETVHKPDHTHTHTHRQCVRGIHITGRIEGISSTSVT